MSDRFGSNEREENVIVLLALVFVHGGDFRREAEQRILRTAFVQHVSNEKFLSVVSGQDGNGRGRITQQTHVHVHGDDVFGFSEILNEVRRR